MVGLPARGKTYIAKKLTRSDPQYSMFGMCEMVFHYLKMLFYNILLLTTGF